MKSESRSLLVLFRGLGCGITALWSALVCVVMTSIFLQFRLQKRFARNYYLQTGEEVNVVDDHPLHLHFWGNPSREVKPSRSKFIDVPVGFVEQRRELCVFVGVGRQALITAALKTWVPAAVELGVEVAFTLSKDDMDDLIDNTGFESIVIEGNQTSFTYDTLAERTHATFKTIERRAQFCDWILVLDGDAYPNVPRILEQIRFWGPQAHINAGPLYWGLYNDDLTAAFVHGDFKLFSNSAFRFAVEGLDSCDPPKKRADEDVFIAICMIKLNRTLHNFHEYRTDTAALDQCHGLNLDEGATSAEQCKANCNKDGTRCKVYQWGVDDKCWRGMPLRCDPDGVEIKQGERKIEQPKPSNRTTETRLGSAGVIPTLVGVPYVHDNHREHSSEVVRFAREDARSARCFFVFHKVNATTFADVHALTRDAPDCTMPLEAPDQDKYWTDKFYWRLLRLLR